MNQAPHDTSLEVEEESESLSFTKHLDEIVEGNLNVNSEVGLILPTYCESANIKKLIDEIENLNMNISILVIDDSSPDKTSNIVREIQGTYNNVLLFVRPKKLGLGTAITDGFKIFLALKNSPKYMVTMDADFSHNPKDVLRVFSVAKKDKGLVIGSRYCEAGGAANWSILRLVISRVANVLASLLVRAGVNDYTSGLRCYSAGLVKDIVNNLHSQTYEIQIETIRQARLQKFNVQEVPIFFMNRKKGKSKLTFTEVQSFLLYIVKTMVRVRKSVSL